MIEVIRELKTEITGLYSTKSKRFCRTKIMMFLASKGRANYLLKKKSSKLGAPRKAAKKYQANLTAFVDYKQSDNPERRVQRKKSGPLPKRYELKGYK